MRRVLLLATILTAPVLGWAQTGLPATGQITFTVTNDNPAAGYINLAQCTAAPGTASVLLNWAATGTPVAGMTYVLYASNQPITLNSGTGHCPTTNPSTTTNTTSWVTVGQITNPNQGTMSVANAAFDPATIASALAVNGQNQCALAADTAVYLCVNAMSGTTPIGHATGQMTVSTYLPDAKPTMTSIGSGNGALTANWSANGSSNTRHYQVQAVSMVPGATPSAAWFDPNGGYTAFDSRDTVRHSSGFVTGTQARVGDLQNGVTYAVAVTGYTVAYNPSSLDPSGIGTGSPQVTFDFWQVYQQDGGRETGGCSTGVAGPLALVILAGTLALTRRRK